MSIFARTLLSFWVATALTLALGGGLLLSRKQLFNGQIQELPLVRLETCASKLVAGKEAVGGYGLTSQTAETPGCPIQFLVSPTGRQLLQNAVPADITDLITEQLHRGGEPLVEMRPGATTIVFRVVGKLGPYCAVAVVPQTDPGPPAVFWVHLLCATAISCVVFWLLARQLTRPIRTLQGVAESVAQGNWTNRPGRELLNRKDELGELSVSIDFMLRKISQLMGSQKAFLAQVSHELGSPLARLNMALALARRKAAPSLDSEFTRLEYESAELNSMIQQLLLLARLENATELNHIRQRFSLAKVVYEVAEDAKFEANQKDRGVRLLVDDAEQWNAVEILGHRDLLKRALDNILRNAIRFTALRTSVEIKCSARIAGEAHITVRDFGEGIPPEQFGAIFEPFLRLPSRGNGLGTGLGLAIARQAVIAHRGSVTASNADTGGLSISIRLPVAPSVNRSERIVAFPGSVAH